MRFVLENLKIIVIWWFFFVEMFYCGFLIEGYNVIESIGLGVRKCGLGFESYLVG